MGDEEKKKCIKVKKGAEEWMVTYGDMVTLLLCFFVILMNPEAIDGYRMEMIMYAFNGLGPLQGGNTLEIGDLAELGNSIMNMPAESKGSGLDESRKVAVSLFQPEIESEDVRITEDERGLVITLASDVFFKPASAELNMEQSRLILQKLSELLSSNALSERYFRIEGHTDTSPTDPDGPWPTNWELSAARSVNVLHYLVDFGAPEKLFQIAGFSSNSPLEYPDDTEEARSQNRRVDVIILAEGHL
ncbi:MAG: flagellar motor protein MotB [Spirochaetaceae bacterium]|jgi:chemotaxis protein MotB|nr:flagellar motor protein MotB [Spirochaetaceae bacterium]